MAGAVILQHVPYEGPGRIIPVFRDFGIPCDIRHLYRGDEVPTDLEDIHVLVVLGGPMGVSDIGSVKYPFLQKEVDLLQRFIALDGPTLGICLGAQLIAHAAGAKVYPNVKKPLAAPSATPTPTSTAQHGPGASPTSSPAGASHPGTAPSATSPAVPSAIPPIEALPELGWAPVTFPFPGGTEPIVFGMTDGAPMFHWHFDTFDLPRLPSPANPPPPPAPPPAAGNALLSSSQLCKNQAFRFKNSLFGFQYHFEMTPEGIDAVLAGDRESLTRAFGERAAEAAELIRDNTTHLYPRHARLGNRLLQNFVQYLKAY
jgi:GMP synthase-like glutamine amidotransferase